MIDFTKDKQKKETACRFVEATREIIDKEGIESVSIRKIAALAGFHNSTIYLYFKNVDQLILLASLKHFTEYSRILSSLSSDGMTSPEKFIKIWNAFGETIFSHPDIFNNFFFGKYSHNLTAIIKLYYELFPDEKPHYSQEIENMYYGNTIFERCLSILEPLVSCDGLLVTEANIQLVNKIIVSCLKLLLEEKCADPSLDSFKLNASLIEMIKHTTGIK